MSKLFAAALLIAVLALDPTSAHLHAGDDSPQLLRATNGDRLLAADSSTSTDGSLASLLYESNTSIKGCHWYDYFLPWSCCGTNQC
ncbi:hypothetical protein PRIC1_004075 [Phytophthora ramorum]|uniref:uncharacterized protein n=1 Tax=Phytophthora ramorum TaxID=164328 RepID=UPI0030992E86|nr:hypothetical protein KRP23_3815 [Phytophthora ramorum]KAH7507849.1 hypothetical protein KRP22_2944 [Phytophthora ramorum]